MQTILKLSILIIILLSNVSGSYAQKLPRLFFVKKIPFNFKYIKYKIKEGEWLYKILRKLNIPEDKFSLVTKIIKKANPQIKDLSHLEKGQIILIPKIYTKYQTSSQALKKYKHYTIQKYKVHPGDTAANILRTISQLPDDLIFNEYLHLLQQINPQVDLNNIEVGTILKVPIPQLAQNQTNASQTLASNLSALDQNQTTFSKFSNKTKSTTPPTITRTEVTTFPLTNQNVAQKKKNNFLSNKEISARILARLGINVMPGTKAYFPQKDGTWIKIDLDQNMIIYHKNKRIILTQELNHPAYPFLSYYVQSWKLSPILSIVSQEFADYKLWPQTQPFLLNQNRFALEIKPLFIIKNKQFFAIFKYETSQQMLDLNLIYSFLKNLRITAIFIYKHQILTCDLIGPQTIYTPKISHEKITPIIQAISKNEVKLERKRIPLTIFKAQKQYVRIYAEFITIPGDLIGKNSPKKIYLYPANNAFIPALYSLKGFKVYEITTQDYELLSTYLRR